MIQQRAMYKTKNGGTGNRMRTTWGIGECYIPGNVVKHSRECLQTIPRMSPTISGNFLKHSKECPPTFCSLLIMRSAIKLALLNFPVERNLPRSSGLYSSSFYLPINFSLHGSVGLKKVSISLAKFVTNKI